MKTITLWLALVFVSGSVNAGLDDVRAAAERGDPTMQFELGELYEFGFRLQDHLVPALAWYTVAAEQGHARAAARRDALKGRLNAAQVAEAQRQSAKLARRPAAPTTKPAPEPAPSVRPSPPDSVAPPPAEADPAATAPTAPLIMEPPTHGPLAPKAAPAPPPAPPKEDLIGPP